MTQVPGATLLMRAEAPLADLDSVASLLAATLGDHDPLVETLTQATQDLRALLTEREP